MTVFDFERFQSRHIGPDAEETAAMLKTVGAPSLDALIDEAIPSRIRLKAPLNLEPGQSEHHFLAELSATAARNTIARSFIGYGYYDTVTPSVILRNVLENPGWYTPYTPYQAEIAQGRLESLLNFQTMVSDLTGMEGANASRLDEATAAAEAMTMLRRVTTKKLPAGEKPLFLVSDRCFPQTIDVLQTRAEPLGIDLQIGRLDADQTFDARTFGVLLQYPDAGGELQDLAPLIARAHAAGALVAVATDLLPLVLVTPPGEMGADVVVGNSQRFGVPLGYGGPHAAFFATRNAFVRQAPGRIIGVSVDAHGKRAYRMALATREQHIRREKATSNICTAQALLANMAAMYAVYHGPEGLRRIATRVHQLTLILYMSFRRAPGLTVKADQFFDTLAVGVPDVDAVRGRALAKEINLRYIDDHTVGVSLDETTTLTDVTDIIRAVTGEGVGFFDPRAGSNTTPWSPAWLARTTPYLTHPVFNTHRSETQMMRYIRALERKDIGLDHSMIPLGSCTMKLNAASEMRPITWEQVGRIHPFAPTDQTEGYQQIFTELEAALCAITGFAAVSLQPNSGAQGEFTGLLVIRAFLQSQREGHRDVVLIPASAHGTNPASAAMAGMRVVVVATAPNGNVDVADFRKKAAEHGDRLACLMITYPSTHGVYEDEIREICSIVHERGGQVYMDGANMNAQVGLTSPASIGADVCHLNLHKTFAIPHGGGGPGMGPIGVAAHLAPFLPGHPIVPTGGGEAIGPVSAAPWGSASILPIPWVYIALMGGRGLTRATEI